MKPLKVLRANTLYKLADLQKILEEMGYDVKLKAETFSIEIYRKEEREDAAGFFAGVQK